MSEREDRKTLQRLQRDIDRLTKERDDGNIKKRARRKAGLCRYCDEPPMPGRSMCEKHTKRLKNQVQRWRNKQIRSKSCVSCYRPLAPGSKRFCEWHRNKRNADRREKTMLRQALRALSGPPGSSKDEK